MYWWIKRVAAPRAMRVVPHQGMPPINKMLRMFMLPSEPFKDKGDVDQVLLVIPCHGVEDEVYP